MIGVQGPAARDSTTQETNQRKKITAINSELVTTSPTPKEKEQQQQRRKEFIDREGKKNREERIKELKKNQRKKATRKDIG